VKRLVLLVLTALALQAAAPAAHAADTLTVTLRGKPITLYVYRAAGATPKGTILMGSGDVGWVGLGVEMAEWLATQGYHTIGINMRQYLSAFTSGKTTMTTSEPPDDYEQIAAFLRARRLLVPPVILSGMSEGAAFAVLAASAEKNHAWVNGVMTMGLPPTAELGWRWTDFTSWITKQDPDEPMFEPKRFLPKVAPVPVCLIHSTKDEYVKEADWKLFEQVTNPPKKLVLINASNHRFTDRKDELKQRVLECLKWMREQTPPVTQ
jgi:type IV secretory pathway VirJ component